MKWQHCTHWQKASAGGGGDPDAEKESEEIMEERVNVLVALTREEFKKLADLTELYAHENNQDTIRWMVDTLHETMFGTEEKRWQK